MPLDAATQTFAFIARKGAGKTYAAGKLAECLMDAGVQVVILDSVGNWWGLRLDADGKTPAYDIPVLGGQLGYTNVKSGGFTGPLGSLRKLGLIEYPHSGTVAASALLFPPGLN